MQNRFNTLNEALESEGLVSLWPIGTNISYNQTARIVRNGKFFSVFRDDQGVYERPIQYETESEDLVQIIDGAEF